MSGSTVGIIMNYGYAGGVSRLEPRNILSKPVKSSSANVLFGQPVSFGTDNTVIAPTTTLISATNFAGVAVAEVKTYLTYPTTQNSVETAYYAPLSMCDVIQQGVVTVFIQRGTSITTGGGVYVRTVLSTSFPSAVIGGFETTSDGSNSVLLTNAKWYANTIDANGMAELKLLYPIV